jgi:hypothetical protein
MPGLGDAREDQREPALGRSRLTARDSFSLGAWFGRPRGGGNIFQEWAAEFDAVSEFGES